MNISTAVESALIRSNKPTKQDNQLTQLGANLGAVSSSKVKTIIAVEDSDEEASDLDDLNEDQSVADLIKELLSKKDAKP